MANIDRIVNVAITLRTAGIQQQSFSDLLLVGNTTMAERFRWITGADELISDDSFGLSSASNLYKAASKVFSQQPSINKLGIGRLGVVTETAADTMAAIRSENDGWYGFVDVERTSDKAIGFADWAEANVKMFGAAVTDAKGTRTSATDLAAKIMNGNYFRSWCIQHSDPTQWPEVSLFAKKFTSVPGSETWAMTTLAGVAADPLTETEAQNVFARNASTFELFRNKAVTQGGTVGAGEWIDVIRGRDWLVEEIRTNVFDQMIDYRIPYTDAGIAIIRQRVMESLQLAQTNGFIAPDSVDDDGTVVPAFTVTVPRARDVSKSDKAARILRNVKFTAILAGAIHVVKINGTLDYDNMAAA